LRDGQGNENPLDKMGGWKDLLLQRGGLYSRRSERKLMFRRLRVLLIVLAGLALLAPLRSWGQSGAADAVLAPAEAAKVLPTSVFFRGQAAPVQGRNSGGVKYGDGMFTLAALVDNSGYSTAVQQKYQAYFITEVPIEINGHALQPGAYGVGFVEGHFGVLDIGNHDLFAVDATRDAGLKRPTPLQVIADSAPGSYRLYEGREYVSFSRPAGSK
jgi:hypothetical protein